MVVNFPEKEKEKEREERRKEGEGKGLKEEIKDTGFISTLIWTFPQYLGNQSSQIVVQFQFQANAEWLLSHSSLLSSY